MILRVRTLFVAAALLCVSLSANAELCRKLEYPHRSLRVRDAGISLIGFLVRADGTVARALVFDSSGSSDLDQATIEGLSRCAFTPATVDGKPVEAWEEVSYIWLIEDDLDMKRAKHDAAVAAAKGDVGARYQLALLLQSTAKTDAERERAVAVLRSAADLGLAHAQFAIGRYLEKGLDGKGKDVEEAMRWYRKAAAQGDVMAIQRLEQGILP